MAHGERMLAAPTLSRTLSDTLSKAKGTTKVTKSTKVKVQFAANARKCTRKWSKRVDEACRLRVGLSVGLSGCSALAPYFHALSLFTLFPL